MVGCGCAKRGRVRRGARLRGSGRLFGCAAFSGVGAQYRQDVASTREGVSGTSLRGFIARGAPEVGTDAMTLSASRRIFRPILVTLRAGC